MSRMRGRNANYLAVMFSEKHCCNIFSGLINAVDRALTDGLKFSACQEQALLWNAKDNYTGALLWASEIKPTHSHYMSFKFSLILSYHRCVRSQPVSGFAKKEVVSISRFVRACYSIPHSSYPPWFYALLLLAEDCKLWSSSLCSFLHPPFTSSLLFSISLSLWLYSPLDLDRFSVS
jgi:hypothetical protein